MSNENELRSDNNVPSMLWDFWWETKRLKLDSDWNLITSAWTSYLVNVTAGNISWQKIVTATGRTPSMIAWVDENIWDWTWIYTYLTADTTLYASSSNAWDTGIVIVVTWLDDTYTEITRTVVLNWQNQVALSWDMFRIFTALVTWATEPLWDIYIAESDTLTWWVPDTASKIKSKIIQGRNITQNWFYTVPAGKTAQLLRIIYIAPKWMDACFSPRVRLFWSIFFKNSSVDLYQAVETSNPPWVSFPEKTDVEVIATTTNTGTVCSSVATLLLIDN